MKFLIGILTMGFAVFAQAEDSTKIRGLWKFTEIIYQGERRPPFSDDLIIHFQFTKEGQSLLHWTRKGEKGFCERRAQYRFDGESLWQKITWVNPNNRMDCASDPDMKPERESTTSAQLTTDELKIKLALGSEDLYYVWKRKDGPWPGEAKTN